ncbi:glucose 1-dehydrogenase [Alkalibaculum sp. M08DMB]|uniref:Glucose 1-dehydrogenase n=1 Tax=Alkalibaculum sporogenes TaxID=2655001 RepID=A0A6A7K5T3_9FIRM|nr:glucose 1-dehydrogenase [Alkalibaculum sporogenes]MPW24714.1 glucose 1-dehydrogenase [Alkalibaculum sporogenes]
MEKMSNTEMKNMFSLEGKVAVITGGAGSLGEGVAEGLALHGADIVVTGRTLKTLEETVKKVEAVGKRALAVVCDATNEDQVEEMTKKVLEKFGKIDILVTVAGIAKRHPAEEFPLDEFQQVLDINVTGTFITCKAVGKVMKEQGYGKIITVSSVRAFNGHPGGYAAYATSKGAVSILTKQLATEWAKFGINVNSVAPAIFWTPLTQEVLEDEKLKKIFLDRIPMGRAALVQDMVGATVFLGSSASDYINGHVLPVDGGTVAG